MAIIVTIMALELQLPEELTVVGLRSMLPMLFIYITSFLQIMAVWLYYHELYKLVDHVSFHLFGANSFWLLTASFVPLATRGIGQHSADFAFSCLPHRSCPLGCSLDNHDSNGDQDESKTVIS